MTQVAADKLSIGRRNVRFNFGDIDLPTAGSPVGSAARGMITVAAHNAAIAFRDHLITLAVSDGQSPLHDADPGRAVVRDGRMPMAGDGSTRESYSSLMQRHFMNDAEAIGSWDPPPLDTPNNQPGPGRWRITHSAAGPSDISVSRRGAPTDEDAPVPERRAALPAQ
jgi:xanthine dehydrogenase YagR molybdenum-binding subunit